MNIFFPITQMHSSHLSQSNFPQNKNLHSLLKNPKSINQIKHIHTQLIRNPHPTFFHNHLIRAYILTSSPNHAYKAFVTMLHSTSTSPDKFSLTFVVNALTMLKDYDNGRAVHGYALKRDLYRHGGLHLANSLMSLYFGCGRVECGWRVWEGMRVRSVVSWTALVKGLLECGEADMGVRVFEMMPVRNVVSWTVVIDWCARNGHVDQAFDFFWRMLDNNLRPNEYTLVALSIACTELGHPFLGSKVHELAQKTGMLESGAHVGTSLINMYSKCGRLEDAVKVFNQMPLRSLATWNSMIMTLSVHGHEREAVSLFNKMEESNVIPDEITFVGGLRACVRGRMVEEGIQLFKRIKCMYRMKPGIEHYNCLVELLDCVEDEKISDLLIEFDGGELENIAMVCRENDKGKLEKMLRYRVREIRCFQWEVG